MRTPIALENSFEALHVEPTEPDEPETCNVAGATADTRQTRSAAAFSDSSTPGISCIESGIAQAIALIDADKHKAVWWALLSAQLRSVLQATHHAASALAQNAPCLPAATPSTSSSSFAQGEKEPRSAKQSRASSDQSPVLVGQSLSATDIESAVARVIQPVLRQELARVLQDLHDSDAPATRLFDRHETGTGSSADSCCPAHAPRGEAIQPPLPALPQATERDITVSLASVAKDHAVRSLSEAEVKAAVDAALARSTSPGTLAPPLVGVKKLANGNLRLRTTSEDAKDTLVKAPGMWLPALAENAQLARDLYTVEVRAVPVSFRPSEVYAIRGLCQANQHVFPDTASVVTMRWLRELKNNDDKRTSSLLVTVDGQLAFSKAIHYGVVIHGRLCDASPYVPSPTQCYFCQGFGHTVTACPRKKSNAAIICARCAGPHATSACSCPHSPACSSRRTCAHIIVKCANCGGRHKSFSVDCPTRRRAAADVARSPKYARALAAYSSSLDRSWGADASDSRRFLSFSASPRAGSAWRD